MPKDSTFIGSQPRDTADEELPRPTRAPVTTAIPTKRPMSPGPGFGPRDGPRGDQPSRPPPAMSNPGSMQQRQPGAPPRMTGGSPAPRSQPSGGGSKPGAKFTPAQPRSIADSGLTTTMVEELILKALFFAGEMRGSELVQKIKLPQIIIDDVIEGLRRSKFVDQKGGAGVGVGKASMIYTVTTFATDLIRQILDRNRYNGPAPVRIEDWVEAVMQQSVRGMRITKSKMVERFGSLVVKDEVFDGLGPALNSGRAIFFYGPPGNGKTALCQSLVQCYDGEIYIPHALLVDDFIIRLFDSTIHQPVAEDANAQAVDNRWVRCKRPLVVVGGELTLETLDLMYSPDVRYYEAPFQLKATNGMLLIDDFGRQQVSPKDLLNRWIVPLESDVDFLTLHTGKKLRTPFNCFVAFSTNLDPSALVDEAFLRRVRYKLEVKPPDMEQFHAIWQGVCDKRGILYDADVVNWLIDEHYRPTERRFAACHPRDLLDQVIDIAAYRGEPPDLTQELVDAAAKNYFVRFDKPIP